MSNINDFVIENGVLKEYTGSDKDVSIPNEVIEIDTWAFKKCEHLINVHIPSSVETIDPQAFYYCTNLSEIHLADGVKCIQANAFDGCNSLMHLNIPSSVISMGGRPGAYFDHADPFSSCLGLQSINVSNDNPVYCSDNFGVLYTKDMTCLTSVPSGLVGEYIIPFGVQKIARPAFENCKNLTGLSIPCSITSVPHYHYFGGRMLKKMKGLVSIKIYSSEQQPLTEQMEMQTNCLNLLRFDLAELNFDKIALSAPESLLSQIEVSAAKLALVKSFIANPSLTHGEQTREERLNYMMKDKKRTMPFVFEADAVEILHMLAERKKITPSNFEEVFWHPSQKENAKQCIAFLLEWKNSNISKKAEDKRVAKLLDKDPFNVTDMKKVWSWENLDDDSIILTSYKGTETIVEIPERIGSYRVTQLTEQLFSHYRKGTTREKRLSLRNIQSIIIPDSVQQIGKRAFEGCDSLQSIVIPGSVSEIPEGLCCGCTKLSDVTILEGVTLIDENAFSNCYILDTITIPATMKKIATKAFAKSWPSKAIFKSGDTRINKGAFCNDGAFGGRSVTIYAPAGGATEKGAVTNKIEFVCE